MQFLEAGRVGVHQAENACTQRDQKRIPTRVLGIGVQCWRGRGSRSRCETKQCLWLPWRQHLRLFRCGRVGMRGLILFLGGGSNEPRTGV